MAKPESIGEQIQAERNRIFFLWKVAPLNTLPIIVVAAVAFFKRDIPDANLVLGIGTAISGGLSGIVGLFIAEAQATRRMMILEWDEQSQTPSPVQMRIAEFMQAGLSEEVRETLSKK